MIVAQTFVAAPFSLAPRARDSRTWIAAISTSPRRCERTGTTFFRIMLPLALPSLLSGAAMSWARALGEFGATITFAGNLPGVTQTMPLAVYLALQSDLEAAIALAVLLLGVSVAVLLGAGRSVGPSAIRVVLAARLADRRGDFALDGVAAPPGTTTVLVGESGAARRPFFGCWPGWIAARRADRGDTAPNGWIRARAI